MAGGATNTAGTGATGTGASTGTANWGSIAAQIANLDNVDGDMATMAAQQSKLFLYFPCKKDFYKNVSQGGKGKVFL